MGAAGLQLTDSSPVGFGVPDRATLQACLGPWQGWSGQASPSPVSHANYPDITSPGGKKKDQRQACLWLPTPNSPFDTLDQLGLQMGVYFSSTDNKPAYAQ